MIILSFVIPLHNLENYILDCLESIIKIDSFISCCEIIVWDDGSTDRSAQLVEEYAKKHCNIILISKENHGVSWVRNHALLEACGKYIWFVDADDLICTEFVSNVLEKLAKFQLDMILFNWKPISETGQIEEFLLHPVKDSNVITGRDLFFSQHVNLAPWCYIYRKDFLINNELTFPEDFKTCEDIQFNQKALWLAKKVMTVSEVGYFYRQMTSSATAGNAAKVIEDHIRRLILEIEYYGAAKDWIFLTIVLYRNLREINVWLNKIQNPRPYLNEVKRILTSRFFIVKPKYNTPFFMIHLMKVCPFLIFRIQKWIKCMRAFFHNILVRGSIL